MNKGEKKIMCDGKLKKKFVMEEGNITWFILFLGWG